MGSYLDPKQQVAHAGLSPTESQSGLFKGKSKLCKIGNKRIKTALYFPALCAINHNPLISHFYEKLVSGGKIKMVVVYACMSKLLHMSVGVLKNNPPLTLIFEKVLLFLNIESLHRWLLSQVQ